MKIHAYLHNTSPMSKLASTLGLWMRENTIYWKCVLLFAKDFERMLKSFWTESASRCTLSQSINQSKPINLLTHLCLIFISLVADGTLNFTQTNNHLLFQASWGGATNNLSNSSHVLHMGVSYSRERAHGMLNSTQATISQWVAWDATSFFEPEGFTGCLICVAVSGIGPWLCEPVGWHRMMMAFASATRHTTCL